MPTEIDAEDRDQTDEVVGKLTMQHCMNAIAW